MGSLRNTYFTEQQAVKNNKHKFMKSKCCLPKINNIFAALAFMMQKLLVIGNNGAVNTFTASNSCAPLIEETDSHISFAGSLRPIYAL